MNKQKVFLQEETLIILIGEESSYTASKLFFAAFQSVST
jgi:hypothetical protein